MSPWIPNTQISSSGSSTFYDSVDLVRFVDYEKGSDANTGLSPHLPMKTIAAAYSNLKTVAAANYTADSSGRLGVGTINLLPGDHDVGTGVSFDWNRPVCLKGTRSGTRSHEVQNTASRIVSSSSAGTTFISIDGGANNICRGISIEDIGFRMDHTVNTALTSLIYAKRVGYFTVLRNSFTNADGTTNLNFHAIVQDDDTSSSGEGGWFRIEDNTVSRLGLYKCTAGGSATGGNFNRGTISRNVVFYGGTVPMIHIDANMNGSLISNNNLEGTGIGCQVGPNGTYTQNMFIANAGEDPSNPPTNPFYNFSATLSQQIIIGGICSSPQNAGTPGTWIAFGANAYRNIVIGVLDYTQVTTSHKRYVSETSFADKNLLIPANVAMTTYTATNVSTDRSYDANATTVDELADVLGTLIADLRARGWVK